MYALDLRPTRAEEGLDELAGLREFSERDVGAEFGRWMLISGGESWCMGLGCWGQASCVSLQLLQKEKYYKSCIEIQIGIEGYLSCLSHV